MGTLVRGPHLASIQRWCEIPASHPLLRESILASQVRLATRGTGIPLQSVRERIVAPVKRELRARPETPGENRALFDRIDDTIVALSSPPGGSVRAVLRLSGSSAFQIADSFFRPDEAGANIQTSAGHRRLDGRVRIAGGSVPAEAYVFRAPASYTRQDVVEFHVVGSPPLLSILLDELVAAGARVAEPGEFTARAFFNGALDLTRVEGVAAAISARTDAQLRASQHLLHGGLGRRMGAYRETLADLRALVEAEIDFVDESIHFVSTEEARAQVEKVCDALVQTLEESQPAERLDVLPEVVLMGLPNAGKSTLLNRLTGLNRAIQSALAGTTRDVLRVPMTLSGGELVLCDSAGVSTRALPAAGLSVLDALAGCATWRAAESADLILFVQDAAQDARHALSVIQGALPARASIRVLSKIDLLSPERRNRLSATEPDAICVSAVTGEGIDRLQAALNDQLFSEAHTRGGHLLALTARQRSSLQEALCALTRARELLRAAPNLSACADVLAMELRDSASALSLLTGDLTTEDLLGRVFARFCIGK